MCVYACMYVYACVGMCHVCLLQTVSQKALAKLLINLEHRSALSKAMP